jgi:hypothetical protein
MPPKKTTAPGATL